MTAGGRHNKRPPGRERRKAGRMRYAPLPLLGDELSPEELVAHRELAAIRNPSPDRFAKLEEARRALEASRRGAT